MSTPINMTQSSTAASREADALRARIETLEAALKNMLDASDALYKLPVDYNEFQHRRKTYNRAIERSRAALAPLPEPAPRPEPETPTLTPYAREQIARANRRKMDEREGKQ